MKKSKIIVPALAVLLLSTAASVTGTVAWFTANRVFEMKAGQFAVVNTKNNLDAIVDGVIGTVESGSDIVLSDNANTLTDASFNPTTLVNDIVEPDDNGVNVDDLIPVATATESNLGRPQSAKIYSAYTWDITFKLSIASNANKVGLYLNFSEGKTWAHEVLKVTDGQKITAAEAGTYKPNADLTGDDVTLTAGDTVSGDHTYYKAAPDDTGKGFRMAFVPKTVPTGSVGYTKVWAPHQTAANSHYINIDSSAIPAFSAESAYEAAAKVSHEGEYYRAKAAVAAGAWNATQWEAIPLSTVVGEYSSATKTMSNNGGTKEAATIAAGLGLMATGITEGDPSTTTHAYSLENNHNYLGYFGPTASGYVEMTYTVVAWYEGTDPTIVNTNATVYETMTTALQFTTTTLTA